MEILNTVTGSPAGTGTLMALLIVLMVLAAAALGYLIYQLFDAIRDRDLDGGLATLVVFSGALCLLMIVFGWRGVDRLHNAREIIVYATINDSTPWSEINERYELIRQDGKIYQLRLREEVGHE